MSLFVVIQECQYSDRHEGVLQRFSSFSKQIHVNPRSEVGCAADVPRNTSFIISLEHPHTIAFAIIPETSTTAVLPGIVFALTIFDTPYFFIFFSASPLSKA